MNKDAAEVLKSIADKLDVPVQQLWAGLVAYAPFTYYQWFAGIAVGLFCALCAFLLLCYCIKRSSGNDEDGVVPTSLLLLVLVLFTGGWFVAGLPDAMAAKNAPEAWAAQQIMKKVGR